MMGRLIHMRRDPQKWWRRRHRVWIQLGEKEVNQRVESMWCYIVGRWGEFSN